MEKVGHHQDRCFYLNAIIARNISRLFYTSVRDLKKSGRIFFRWRRKILRFSERSQKRSTRNGIRSTAKNCCKNEITKKDKQKNWKKRFRWSGKSLSKMICRKLWMSCDKEFKFSNALFITFLLF
jgi:hypothetical protein